MTLAEIRARREKRRTRRTARICQAEADRCRANSRILDEIMTRGYDVGLANQVLEDMIVFGTAIVETRPDGSMRAVNPLAVSVFEPT